MLTHPRAAIRRLAAVLALVTLLGAVASLSAPAVFSQGDVSWDRYDVDIEVRSDGSMRVVETQAVTFRGYFSAGFAEIPLDRIEDIGNLSVYVGSSPNALGEATYEPAGTYDAEPGTFTYEQTFDTLVLDYGFEPTSYGETRYVRVEYDVLGALRVYPDEEPANQQLWWIAISDEVTDIAPVDASTVTVTLPEEVAETDVVVDPADVTVDGATWTWQRTDLDVDDMFEVRIQFPPITSDAVPGWQQIDDQRRAAELEREEDAAVAGTIFFGAGIAVLLFGGVALFVAWYTGGRDPHVGPVADFLAEPPDDLSPGLAGTLVDERVQVNDILATVMHLAHRKVIRIDESGAGAGPFGLGSSYNHQITYLENTESLKPYEERLLQVMFGSTREAGATVKMGDFRDRWVVESDAIADDYYAQLVEKGYFSASPQDVRKRWGWIATGLTIAVVLIILAVQVTMAVQTGWVLFPIIVAIVIGFAARRLAPSMPRKTREGAESAAKWRAFRSYLKDIEARKDIAESGEIFERYLPYAVAFQLESSFVRKFTAAQKTLPQWFGGGMWIPDATGHRPVRRTRRAASGWGGGFPDDSWGQGADGRGGSFGGGGGGFGGFPDLQGTSDSGGRSLQSGSDSFFSMLQSAADAFASSSSSSGGGGFSGGGRSRSSSRRSGGGSRRSGGGGGGRRGFR